MAKSKAATPNPNPQPAAKRELAVNSADAETAKRDIAKVITAPALAATRVILIAEGQSGPGAKLDLMAMVDCLKEQAAKVNTGDLARVEAMLFNQATALQSLFARLVERGMVQDCMPNLEGFMRLALRAQAQCTRTLEVLANVKNPPVVIARQANIAQQQQVNNTGPAVPSRARKAETTPNKLLEELPGERLDTRTKSTTSGADSRLATVGTVHWPEVGSG